MDKLSCICATAGDDSSCPFHLPDCTHLKNWYPMLTNPGYGDCFDCDKMFELTSDHLLELQRRQESDKEYAGL